VTPPCLSLQPQAAIGNRVLNRANQAELFADFSGKDDLALVVDLSGGSIQDGGKIYTQVQVELEAARCLCFEDGKSKLSDEYADVSSRVLPRLKDMPLLGVTHDVSARWFDKSMCACWPHLHAPWQQCHAHPIYTLASTKMDHSVQRIHLRCKNIHS
jgi:hypothetical protein